MKDNRLDQPISKLDSLTSMGHGIDVMKTIHSGVQRSSDNPFATPAENVRRNETRFTQMSAILRTWAQVIFKTRGFILSRSVPGLTSSLDNLFSRSHRDYAVISKAVLVWFKVFVLSGRSEKGNIPDLYWNPSKNCPHMLENILRALVEEADPTIRRLIIRWTISYLSIPDCLIIPTAPSLQSITDPFSGDDITGSSIDLDTACKNLGIVVEDVITALFKNSENHSFFFSNAAGPNGHAVWASHLDAYELDTDKPLLALVENLGRQLHMAWIIDVIASVCNLFAAFDIGALGWTGGSHSRLHVLYEKGTKSRVIAIGDYFSQNVLAPIHKTLAGILKTIPMDCTFDQIAGFNAVLKMSSVNDEMYSLDLSKATDRLPALAQRRILEHLFGETIADLWYGVLTSREFMTENGHKVKYRVGQPMGFKSSFVAMALLHHFVVQEAAKMSGLTLFSNYVLLGDDIVIGSKVVAENYMSVMKSLGMEISIHKSVFPGINKEKGAEFCSRLALNGQEMTGLPIRAISNIVNNGSGLTSLWDVLRARHLFIGVEIWDFLSIFLDNKQLEYLMLLNSLPSDVSGIQDPLPYEGAENLSDENFSQNGFNKHDVENFYWYVLVSEALSKISSSVDRTLNIVSILQSESKTRPEDFNVFLQGTPQSLSLLVNAQAHKVATLQTLHPIQEVVKTVGRSILNILNMLNAQALDYKRLILSGDLECLNFDLEQRANYAAPNISPLGDRRVLEKALRLCQAGAKDPKRASISYTGKIEGVTQNWVVRVSLGGKLVVSPHVRKLDSILASDQNKLKTIGRSVTLGSFFVGSS